MSANTKYHKKIDFWPSLGIDPQLFPYTKSYILQLHKTNPSFWTNTCRDFVACSNCQAILFYCTKERLSSYEDSTDYNIVKFDNLAQFNSIFDHYGITNSYLGNWFGHFAFSLVNKMRKPEARVIESGFLIINHDDTHAVTPFENIKFQINKWSLPFKKTMIDINNIDRGPRPFEELRKMGKSMFVLCAFCNQGPIGFHAMNLNITVIFADEDVMHITRNKKNVKISHITHHRVPYKET